MRWAFAEVPRSVTHSEAALNFIGGRLVLCA